MHSKAVLHVRFLPVSLITNSTYCTLSVNLCHSPASSGTNGLMATSASYVIGLDVHGSRKTVVAGWFCAKAFPKLHIGKMRVGVHKELNKNEIKTYQFHFSGSPNPEALPCSFYHHAGPSVLLKGSK